MLNRCSAEAKFRPTLRTIRRLPATSRSGRLRICDDFFMPLLGPAFQTGSGWMLMNNQDNVFRLSLRGNVEDVLAAMRTAVLVAKSVKTTLRLDLEGSECFKAHFGSAASDEFVAGFLDSVRRQLALQPPTLDPGFEIQVRILSNEAGFSLAIRRASPMHGG